MLHVSKCCIWEILSVTFRRSFSPFWLILKMSVCWFLIHFIPCAAAPAASSSSATPSSASWTGCSSNAPGAASSAGVCVSFIETLFGFSSCARCLCTTLHSTFSVGCECCCGVASVPLDEVYHCHCRLALPILLLNYTFCCRWLIVTTCLIDWIFLTFCLFRKDFKKILDAFVLCAAAPAASPSSATPSGAASSAGSCMLDLLIVFIDCHHLLDWSV